MWRYLLVGCGGFIGAIARYAMSGFVQQRWGGTFPLGTLAVNVLGCLVLGGLMSLVEDHPLLSPSARAFWAIGILGAFTTFSTFGYETVGLIELRRWGAALAYVGLNLCVGVAAVVAGRLIVRWLGI
jgi:CrcB protein